MIKNGRTYFICILSFLSICACNQTNNTKENKVETIKIDNPLLCDPVSGICEIPNIKYNTAQIEATNTSNKPIKLIYFTDPICSSCWGIEPQLKKMKLEYGDYIDIEYRMGGLLPDWSYNSGGISKPADVALHWDEVSIHYQMPIDGDVWLEDPLDSSYPPSIAFKAAQLQDEQRAIKFLRRMREMVFLEKKNICKWEYISAAAQEIALDTALLKMDFDNSAKQLFQEDLELAKAMRVRGFPTLYFIDVAENQQLIHGSQPYSEFESTIKKALPSVQKKTYLATPKNLFKQFATLTTKEFAVLSNQNFEEAEKVLNVLFQQNLLQKTTTKNGILWIGKSTRF